MDLSARQVRESLRGVSAGLLTPFAEDGEINYHHLESNARDLESEGVDSFLVTANISEYHSLSDEERVEMAKTALESLAEDSCVLAGVGGSTQHASELIRQYGEAGVDAMMIMPPDHTYLHERGLLQYYKKLANGTDRPLVPYVRGFNPSTSYLGELTRIDGIVGIKYANDDLVTLGAGIAKGNDDVVWVNGLAEAYSVSFWAEGVEGFTAGVSNFRPELGLELFDALEAENWKRARELRNIALPLQNIRGQSGENNEIPGAVSIPVVKKGLELSGLHGGNVREPIYQLSDEMEKQVEDLYEELDRNIDRIIGSAKSSR